ncbi:MAG: hypothetical protein KIT17_17510 [Rubrivivax sp.]|nr:hypothetical protein [Rubrivivax sp.]
MSLLSAAATAWLVILVLAIANGALREAVLVPRLGLLAGTVTSGVLLIAAVFAVAFALVAWRRPLGGAQAWWIGVGWLAATLVFEFGFGRFVQGKPWPELLAAYTFKDGNLWPLVLVAVLLAPTLGLHAVGGRAAPPE